MISLTRLDGSRFILNADLIETVEARPDTVITLVGKKRVLVVQEPPSVVVEHVVEFRRRIGSTTSRPCPVDWVELEESENGSAAVRPAGSDLRQRKRGPA